MAAIARWLVMGMALLAATGAVAQSKLPTERGLEALVKSALLTFNDANVTGNYTVLHAKLSKPFRQQFTPERLRQTFREFAQKNIDFDIIAAIKPVYDLPPTIDDEGKLVVEGYFPVDSARVIFELGFIPSDGDWKLIRINVETKAAP